MRSGNLRHRITIERLVKTQDETGEEIDQWNTVLTRWASIRPAKGRELVEAAQNHAVVSHTIEMRHCRQVQPDMRAVWTDEQQHTHTYNILSVTHPSERTIKTVLACTEVVMYG